MNTATDLQASPDRAATATPWNRIGFWLPHLVILAYCFVILAAMSTQFIGGEMPCPLCILQRMAMFLIAISQLWIIGRARRGSLSLGAYVGTFGFTLVAALLGAAMSTRQILLHIVPPDPGYGGTVLGLHLYTWALITFLIVMLYVAVMVIFARYTVPVVPVSRAALMVSRVIVVVFLVVLAANLVSIFFEEGFNWLLLDDPTGYELLHQLGIK